MTKTLQQSDDSASKALNQDVFPQPSTQKRSSFQGRTLVDKLLRHYSKFEDDRVRAVQYAQKLLDLGHIESILPMPYPPVFNDSEQMYKWSNAEDVLRENGAKEPIAPKQTSPVAKKRSKKFEKIIQIPHSATNGTGGDGQNGIVKIFIETDNCNGTEIQVLLSLYVYGL